VTAPWVLSLLWTARRYSLTARFALAGAVEDAASSMWLQTSTHLGRRRRGRASRKELAADW